MIDPDACSVCRISIARAQRWSRLRFALGMLQMGGAVAAAVLLWRTGVSTAALAAVVTTTAATSVSVLLFGGRRAMR